MNFCTIYTRSINAGFRKCIFTCLITFADEDFVVSTWRAEAQDYDYASNTCRKVCGHYTQVVWASTKQLGCGVARDSKREVWVCNYDPPGNWVGKRPY